MILDQLALHDFGVYGGRQSIELTPKPHRPVILFGGLNGGGKTTLLDAFQLCLFGAAARVSNRNGHTYEDYLRRCIHHGAASPGASIEMSFRHRVNGTEQGFRLHRSWSASKSSVREQFEVLRDGRFDRLATEHWGAQVEDFIPARIAHLFLFDGEKVESYADLAAAPALVATAVQNLLGLDIVERLTADLGSLERRHRTEAKPPAEQKLLEEVREQLRTLESARVFIAQARAAATNAKDKAQRDVDAIEDQYRREGGTLYEQKTAKETQLAAASRQLDSTLRALRDAVAGPAPLLLIADLLAAVQQRDGREESARRALDTLEALRSEHQAMLAHPVVAGLSASQRKTIARSLDERLKQRAAETEAPMVLRLESGARAGLASLQSNELNNAQSELRRLTAEEADGQRQVEELRAEIAAIPSHDVIAALEARRIEARRLLQAAIEDHEAKTVELARIDEAIAALHQREERLVTDEARARFAQEDTIRLLTHAARVRGTLSRFREAVVIRHVERIQALVLDSFRQLARKAGLIGDLQIDPVTFELTLRAGDGRPVSAERLSAGERQLLAIAILWGLARAAGRPLPTVIDTPLGRLDSEHRDHLVRRYFPCASHQVLLLSTDEEITGRHYAALRPAISREYRLRFDDQAGRTMVEPGYFARPEEAVHVH